MFAIAKQKVCFNLGNKHASKTFKQESYSETNISIVQRVAASPKGTKVKQTENWMFLMYINIAPGTKIPGIGDPFIFSILQSSSSHFWKIFLSTLLNLFLFFFFNLCTELEFHHIDTCSNEFKYYFESKILIERMTVFEIIPYCKLADSNSCS